jgi:hypothetical protein
VAAHDAAQTNSHIRKMEDVDDFRKDIPSGLCALTRVWFMGRFPEGRQDAPPVGAYVTRITP